ncbi:MAG: hypothetical protein H6739_34330 [Alphaproteobacteria bacterium]|nr:hypothetical protein [Alphaproteobacteria bacterium]
MSLGLAALPLALAAEPALQWRWDAGAEVNATPHGIADLSVRRGDWSANLFTDTLDLRWDAEGDGGRRWLAARLEVGAAGLMLSPWTDGGPDPDRALNASYLGMEGGRVWYGPEGLYAGFQWLARAYVFGAMADTTVEVPDPRGLLTGDALLGWWTPDVQAWARVGVDVTAEAAAPHAHLEIKARAPWRLAPRLALRAGFAERQDFLTRTRLGGMNPYVVPVAGAAWAEWWVEDYVAARLGPHLQGEHLSLALSADLAAFDGQQALGLEARGGLRGERWFGELAYGYAPFIERQPGVGRAAVYATVGMDWGPKRE